MKPNHYTVVSTARYKKDIKRLRRSGYDMKKLDRIVDMIAAGDTLPARCRPHALQGELRGTEECHIEGDWLLQYQRRKHILVLVLLRTGTHSDLFGE